MLCTCDKCGNEVECVTLAGRLCPQCRGLSIDEISKNQTKQRDKAKRVVYISFRVLGLISLWVSFLTFGAVDTSGLPGVIGFMVILPLGIPLLLAILLGPGLSLIVGRNDRCLMSMTGLTILLVILSGVVGARALSPLFFAYGIACMTIGAKWITKMNKRGTSNDSQN